MFIQWAPDAIFSFPFTKTLLTRASTTNRTLMTLIYAINLIISRLCRLSFFTTLRKKPFKNIVEKGENAVNQHFLLFPQCFLDTLSKKEIIILATFTVSSANAFNSDQSRILSSGKEFKIFLVFDVSLFSSYEQILTPFSEFVLEYIVRKEAPFFPQKEKLRRVNFS